MGLKIYNNMEYKNIIGLPSGEILNLPRNLIKILIKNDLVEINFIEKKRYYIFDDDDLKKILKILEDIDEENW